MRFRVGLLAVFAYPGLKCFSPVKILASFFSSSKEKSCVWSRSILLLLQLSKTSSVASRHPSLVQQSLSDWIFLRCLTRWESCQTTASKDDVEWHFKHYGNCYCVPFGALFDVTAAARGLCLTVIWSAGGHPAEWHSPCSGHPWAHEDPGGLGKTQLGEGIGDSTPYCDKHLVDHLKNHNPFLSSCYHHCATLCFYSSS